MNAINPLQAKHVCFIYGLSVHCTANTLCLGYTKPISECCLRQKSVCCEIHTHNTQMQCEHQAEILNVKPVGT